MLSLSRPYQIALAAAAVLGLVWVVALRGHGSRSSEPSPTSRSSSTAATAAGSSGSSAAAQAKTAATPTPIYHGAAPGVEGLTRAIAKAHGAVALSERSAQQLQRKSGEASDEAAAATRTGGAATPARTTSPGAKGSVKVGAKGPTKSEGASAPSAFFAKRTAVERALAHGKTVVLLFWDPKSAVDVLVHRDVRVVGSRSKGTVSVFYARADQVGQFRAITEVAYVFQTPTVLIVNRHGVVSTLTGLTDVFALEQAVREARRVGRR